MQFKVNFFLFIFLLLCLSLQSDPENPNNKKRKKAMLGVYSTVVERGIQIKVTIGGPAQMSGLKDGDIIYELAGHKIKRHRDLFRTMMNFYSGDVVKVKFIRSGVEKELDITFGKMPVLKGMGIPDVLNKLEGNQHLTDADYMAGPLFSATTIDRLKLRKMAMKSGTLINWRTNYTKALEEADKTKKPIFLSVGRSFDKITFTEEETEMDKEHKSLIIPDSPTYHARHYDTHLRTTLFSYDSTRRLIEEQFIPLRYDFSDDKMKVAKKYNLYRYSFIEPGFLMISPDGDVAHQVDRISVFNEEFFHSLLTKYLVQHKYVKSEKKIEKIPSVFDGVHKCLSQDQFDKALELCQAIKEKASNDKSTVASCFYKMGQISWLQKREKQAQGYWTTLCEKYPEQYEASLAAVNLLGDGALIHGFETFSLANTDKLQSLAKNSQIIQNTFSEKRIVQETVKWLLRQQRSNGAWTDSHYDFLGVEHRHNTYMAISAIDGLGLQLWRHVDPKGIDKALNLLDNYLTNFRNLSYSTVEKVYAYSYGLLYASERIKHVDEKKKKLFTNYMNNVVKNLTLHQAASGRSAGAWGHEYYNPFVTSTVLHALVMAQKAKITVSENILKRGCDSLLKVRGREGGFPYSFFDGIQSSVGEFPNDYTRSAFCELSIAMASQTERKEELKVALAHFFDMKDAMIKARKYDFHAGIYGEAGFFYFNNLHGISECLLALGDEKLKESYGSQLREMVLESQQIDGSFVDSPNIGKGYGSGAALIVLKNLDRLKNK